MSVGETRIAPLFPYALAVVDGLPQSLANDMMQYSRSLYRLRARRPVE